MDKCGGCGRDLELRGRAYSATLHAAQAPFVLCCPKAGYLSTLAPLVRDSWWPVEKHQTGAQTWYKYVEQSRRKKCQM